MAERIERRLAATPAAPASDTPEPEPPAAAQPEQAADQAATAPPQPSNDVTPEPEQPQAKPPRPPLNREQRRRLAALACRVQPAAVSPSVCAGSP
jgi:hypothetical protein